MYKLEVAALLSIDVPPVPLLILIELILLQIEVRSKVSSTSADNSSVDEVPK